jgi:hypothetical protein
MGNTIYFKEDFVSKLNLYIMVHQRSNIYQYKSTIDDLPRENTFTLERGDNRFTVDPVEAFVKIVRKNYL